MIDAVEMSSRQVVQSREEIRFSTIFFWSFLTFIFGLMIGMGAIYYGAFKSLKDYQQNDIQKYQNVINMTNAYAQYINGTCDRKQSFSYFVNGSNSKKFNCNGEWLSGNDLLKKQ